MSKQGDKRRRTRYTLEFKLKAVRLNGYGVRSSMSRKGNCWDYVPTESLWGSKKVGRLYGKRFPMHRDAIQADRGYVSSRAGGGPRRWGCDMSVRMIISRE